MAAKSPAPAPQTPGQRVRNFLGWAFGISIAVHLVFGAFLGNYKPYQPEQKEVEKVTVQKAKVIVPTPPPPTPTPPPPTPPPKQTPPPVHATKPPPQPKLKVNVPKTNSKSNSGPSETKYNVTKGSQSGVPQGTVASAAPVRTAGPATAPPPPPTPPPTPKPQCAVPNKEATMTNGVQPDTPEIAKQAGATGTVNVEVTLTAGGSVVSTSVYKSSGNSALDQAAIAAAKQSSFAPATKDCQPVGGSYLFRADFEGQ
ncbi:MAG: TonB family protein [Candidatus Baltobacteraceae bacterium]